MKNLRDEMPEVAGLIDALRNQFGLLPVDRQIRRAMKGEPVFFARENGQQFGTPAAHGAVAVWRDEKGISQIRPVVESENVLQITLPSWEPVIAKPKVMRRQR